MRADRLIQALLLLQGRPRITAAELAAELEVSVPTARRDLEALAMAGVPIYPTRGRGGGWRLIGGARTDLTGLTETEVTSVLIALTQTLGADPERIAAMRKLVRAMPAPFRDGAQRVAEATVRDAPWGEAPHEAESATLAELQRSIAGRRRVRIDYEGAKGHSSAELVPLVVGSRGARWYLLAAPAVDDAEVADADRLRTYRVDRIVHARMLPDRGMPAEGFDTQEAWHRMVQRVEEMRGAMTAKVRVEPWAVRALCDRFGAQAKVVDGAGIVQGRVLVEVSAHRTDALAEQLVGWVDVAEVVDPPLLRAAMRGLGERITAIYDT